MNTIQELSHDQQSQLFKTLQLRFEKNMHRHAQVQWSNVVDRITQNPAIVKTLSMMEESGGEPDVVDLYGDNRVIFVDCSLESPLGRRSLCYDRKALEARKENKPASSVMDMAQTMGIELLNEEEYRKLQSMDQFDRKTSSWLKTPEKIRALGGAIFGDRRYDTVFIYHNGADSYYAARGFRGKITI